jgi:hypothetical protein
MQYRGEFSSNSSNPFNSIFSILMVILVMLGLFYIARFIFTILYYLSPIMLIAALIIDHKVVTGYGKWVVSLFKKNPIMGVGSVLLTVIGFPIVSAFLLGRALFRKRVRQAQEEVEIRREGQFIEYEELDSEPLELPEIQKEERNKSRDRNSGQDYDHLFDE